MAILIPRGKLVISRDFHVASDLYLYLSSFFDLERFTTEQHVYWKVVLEFHCEGRGRSGKVIATTDLPNHLEWAFSDHSFDASHLIKQNETPIAEWLSTALVSVNMSYARRVGNVASDTSNYIFEVTLVQKDKLQFVVPAWDLRGIIMPRSIVWELFQLTT